MRKRLVLVLRIAVAAAFAAIAINVLMVEFGSLSLAELGDGLERIGWGTASAMALATLAGFAAVATYDTFALRYQGKRLSLMRSALSSAGSYAISNLLGFAVFTGNAVRFWLFERWGFGVADVAVAAITGTIVANLTLAIIAGVSLLIAPSFITQLTGFSAPWGMGIGLVLLIGATGLAAFAIAGPRSLTIGRFNLNRPGPLLLLQLPVSVVDYGATAAVLYIPLSQSLSIDFLPFVALFSTAKLIGIVSNVPGGLGVFEAVIASSMSTVPAADLAAALLAYRAIFYLMPFGIAAGAIAAHGLVRTTGTALQPPSTPSD